MKKYLYKIVIASLILMSATVVKATNEVYYTNINNIEMSEKEYNNLLGLGFTINQIYNMDEEEFLENKDIEGVVLDSNTKYYKRTTVMHNGIKYTTNEELTEEEALQQSQNLPTRGPSGNYYDGITATVLLKVTSYIIGVSNTYMRYKVNNEFLNIPSERYHDIIGIGLEPNKVEIGSTIVFKENWTTNNNDHYYDNTGYPKAETGGGSTQIQLPSGNIITLDSYLYYNVKKKANVGTITELTACGDYAHATSYVDPNTIFYNYMMTNSGILIDPPYGILYDQQSPACAYFVGTW